MWYSSAVITLKVPDTVAFRLTATPDFRRGFVEKVTLWNGAERTWPALFFLHHTTDPDPRAFLWLVHSTNPAWVWKHMPTPADRFTKAMAPLGVSVVYSVQGAEFGREFVGTDRTALPWLEAALALQAEVRFGTCAMCGVPIVTVGNRTRCAVCAPIRARALEADRAARSREAHADVNAAKQRVRRAFDRATRTEREDALTPTPITERGRRLRSAFIADGHAFPPEGDGEVATWVRHARETV